MEADPAHELEPEDADLSQAATERDPVFVPDRLDHMVLSAECPVYP